MMMNYFTNGFWHPFSAPTHLLLIISLGLLYGQQGWQHLRISLPIFIMSVCGVLLIKQSIITLVLPNQSLILLFSSLLIGAITAIYWRLPRFIMVVISIWVALLLGLDSEPLILPGFSQIKIYQSLGGIACGISLLLLIATLFSTGLQNIWQGVLVRALSSWVIASSGMVLTLSLTKNITI